MTELHHGAAEPGAEAWDVHLWRQEDSPFRIVRRARFPAFSPPSRIEHARSTLRESRDAPIEHLPSASLAPQLAEPGVRCALSAGSAVRCPDFRICQ